MTELRVWWNPKTNEPAKEAVYAPGDGWVQVATGSLADCIERMKSDGWRVRHDGNDTVLSFGYRTRER